MTDKANQNHIEHSKHLITDLGEVGEGVIIVTDKAKLEYLERRVRELSERVLEVERRLNKIRVAMANAAFVMGWRKQ